MADTKKKPVKVVTKPYLTGSVFDENSVKNTIRNACIITAILPFMVLYPFLQKYFVKGINIGAVKE